jgi:hypothetical protein
LQEVASWDPFGNWELNTRPEGTAEDDLLAALDLFYGQVDVDLARRFLGRCLEITQRTLAENKLQSPRCVENAPENRGYLLRVQTYARAILGESWDETALLEASGAIEEACNGYPKRKWDDYQEARYLEAVRLALLSGNAESVQRLLQRRRAFRAHVEEHEFLKVLAAALTARVPVRDETFRIRFDAYFDQVRNPDYSPVEYSRVPILRLEMGLLRDKYLISPNGKIDWQRALDAIAE